MKRISLFIMLLVFNLGIIFAQNKNEENWFSGEIATLFGVGFRYEKLLNKKFSIGALFTTDYFVNSISIGMEATGRWYPFKGKFFSELGLGFGYINCFTDYDDERSDLILNGLRITPAIGWKINIAETQNFFINPMINIPVIIVKYVDSYDDVYVGVIKEKIGIALSGRIFSFGLGGSF